MADAHLPSPYELRKLLSYDPDTGKLFWLPRAGETRGERYFNTRYAGKEALTFVSRKGYLTGSVLAQDAKAHRVAWAIHYGEWPNGMVDHINGDCADNRICNLRVVDWTGNGRNRKLQSTNTTGFTGVGWVKATSRWRAMIRVDGRHIYLGAFAKQADAIRARKEAEKRYGFSERHGT